MARLRYLRGHIEKSHLLKHSLAVLPALTLRRTSWGARLVLLKELGQQCLHLDFVRLLHLPLIRAAVILAAKVGAFLPTAALPLAFVALLHEQLLSQVLLRQAAHCGRVEGEGRQSRYSHG